MSRSGTIDDDALLEEEVLSDLRAPAPSRVDAKAVATLADLFPQQERSVLERAVAAHPGNLDAAASMVAGGGAEAAARAELEAADERLALTLQAEETAARNLRPPARAATAPTAQSLASVVDVLRDIVVPSLHERFKQLAFADVSEEAGAVRYSLRDVRVVALALPADQIVVRVVDGGVRVQLINMFLQIAVERWRYESTGFLSWSDAGALETSVAGLGATADLSVRQSAGGAVSLAVRDVSVAVEGAVRIRAQGTAADWAYNTMAAVCKPLIVSYVKETIEDQLRASLTDELRNWNSEPEDERAEQDSASALRSQSSPQQQAASASDGTTTTAS